jgi:hypothetical protein
MREITRLLIPRRSITELLAAVVVATAAFAARAGELTILRYDRLAGFSVDESSDGAASATRVSFSAFGAPFDLLLTPNDALTRNLSPETLTRLAGTTFLHGALDGNSQSWARITRTGDALSGAIWDGAELYAIESFAQVAAYVVAGPAVAPADIVIYRWSDTSSAVTDLPTVPTLAESPAKAGSSDLRKASVVLDAAAAQLKLAPAKQLDIGWLADSEFVQKHGTSTEMRMLSIANVVDGIFLDQAGVRMNVAELRTYAEPDAFSGTDAVELLSQLERFKFETSELRSRGVVHLLTGRDLDERSGAPANSRLLGIANFSAVCDERLGVSLTQYTDLNSAAIVAAHEIGHNLGAPHDAESGSPCESMSDGFIMNPFLNGSRQFSECSLQQMELELAAAACLTEIPPNDLAIQPLSSPAEAVATREFDIAFAVDYGGAGEAIKPQLTMTSTNARFWSTSATVSGLTCRDIDTTIPDTAQTCTFSNLPAAGGRVTFEVRLFDTQAGPVSIDIQVTSLNDNAPANNRYRFDLNALSDSRFVRTSSAAPIAAKPEQTFDVDWVIMNQGPIPATNALAEVRLSHELELIEVQTPSGGGCVRGPIVHEAQWLCPVGTMAPGASAPVKVRVRANPVSVPPPGFSNGAQASLKMTANEPIFDWQNEWVEFVAITPIIVDVYVVDFTVPASAIVGSDVAITLRIANRGPDTAPGAGMDIRTWGRGLTFNSATSSRGTCTKQSTDRMDCDFGSIASGAIVELMAQATVGPDLGTFDLEVTAGSTDTFDIDQDNNRQATSLQVEEPPPPPSPPAPSPTPTPAATGGGGGGGGGSTNLAWLLLLVGSALCRPASRLYSRRAPRDAAATA